MFRSLILPALTATLTLFALWKTTAPIPSTLTAPETLASSDINIDDELRTGCDQLIDLALRGGEDAQWAISELKRATSAPWATDALRVQARAGLARVDEWRQVVTVR